MPKERAKIMPSAFKNRYWISKKLASDLTKLSSAMYAESHPEAEINNPKPLFEYLGITKPLSMEEKLDRLFMRKNGLIDQMYDQGEETPEDFDDFNIPEDVEPLSPYEFVEMPPDPSLSNPPPSEVSDKEPNPKEPNNGDRPEGGSDNDA